jgi:DNA-binding HxlR family transcriptional regulator
MLFSAPPRHRLLRDNARNSRALRDAGRQPEKRGKGMNEPLSDHVMRGDVMSEHCPSREVLKHVTSRWGVLLLVALGDGTQRFGELRRKVGGISERMLIQTLQWLEQDGFVQRTAHAGSSPRVEYRLTPLGQEISARLQEVAGWIERNLDAILAGSSVQRQAQAPA